MKRLSIALVAALFFGLFGCTVEQEAPEIKVESITIDQEDLTLTEGESVTLTATVLPEKAVDKTIMWTSSNDEVVMISSNGRARALAAGSAVISATAGEKSDFLTVTVITKTERIEVETVLVDQEDTTITVGESINLTASVLPEIATEKTVTWSSSNEDVVMVSSSGKAKAISVGESIIKAEAGGKSDFITITVNAQVVHVTRVALNPSSLSLQVGQSQELTVEITPENATEKTVTWSSSNNEVATISNGTVSAIKPGSITITATTVDGNNTAECAVTVFAPSVTISAEYVSAVSAVLSGKANIGSSASSDLMVGFQYSLSSGILPSNSITVEALDADLEYNYSTGISGLEPNTTYYYRALVRQNGQDYYGDTQSFKTKALSSLLETINHSEIKCTEATLNAKLDLSDVYYKDIAFGFYWGISEENLNNRVECDAVANNAYYATLKGILPGTTFWYKAFVAFDGIFYYGEKQSFATPLGADLGLSVVWAACNIGANMPEDYGDYYAWGEIDTKSNYNWPKYQWCKGSSDRLTKYNNSGSYGTVVDNKTVLDPEDDVAHVKLGGSWRMPTIEEWTELRAKCTWTWTTENGVNGYRVTGTNGNSIFLPAAGYRHETYLEYPGSRGYYWSSSLNTDDPSYAWRVDFYSDGIYKRGDYRLLGQSVRPVSE